MTTRLRISVTAMALAIVLGSVLGACGNDQRPSRELVREGRAVYERTCAACHGVDLRGTEGAGPPFLNKIYAPDHHPDEAFYNAVENGVQPHHWEFGAMPPQTTVTEDELEAIIAYVRSRQRDAGITSKSTPRPTR
jgi:mono/diheme cytochrome c family protein